MVDFRVDGHSFAGSEVTYDELEAFTKQALSEGLDIAEGAHPSVRSHIYEYARGQCSTCMNTISDIEESLGSDKVSVEINRNWALSYGSSPSAT